MCAHTDKIRGNMHRHYLALYRSARGVSSRIRRAGEPNIIAYWTGVRGGDDAPPAFETTAGIRTAATAEAGCAATAPSPPAHDGGGAATRGSYATPYRAHVDRRSGSLYSPSRPERRSMASHTSGAASSICLLAERKYGSSCTRTMVFAYMTPRNGTPIKATVMTNATSRPRMRKNRGRTDVLDAPALACLARPTLTTTGQAVLMHNQDIPVTRRPALGSAGNVYARSAINI